MIFEWDDTKNSINKWKHKISFEEAIRIFKSDFTIIYDDSHSESHEERFWAIGRLNLGTIIVVFTELDEALIRIISARRASRSEALKYE